MHTLSKMLSNLSLWFSALGLIGMTLIIGWQVFARYVLNAAPAWTEQAALFLMLWFILFASAAGVRENFHIRLSLALDLSKGSTRTFLSLAGHFIVFLFGLSMAWNGAILVAETWQHVIPTLGLSRGTAYIPIVAAGALIAFFSAEHMAAELSGREVRSLWS